MDVTVLIWIAAVVLVVLGVVGTVLPALPGPALILGGLVLLAWADGFVRVGGGIITILAGLTVGTYAVDLAATAFGAKRFGASRRAIVGAVVGTVAGIFFGLPGLIVGPFLGAVLAEYTVRRNFQQAGRAGLGAWIGMVVGTAAKLALVFAMLGVFVAAYLL